MAELLQAFPDEQHCIDHLTELRWPYHVISPFDASSKVYYCPNNTYKCKKSGKYFNVKTGTSFHNSKIDLQKWFIAIWLLAEKNKSLTSVTLGEKLGITQKTAWYMIQRIRGRENELIFSENTPVEKPLNQELTPNDTEPNKLPILDWLTLYQIKK